MAFSVRRHSKPRPVKTVFHLIETSGPGGAETVFVELIRGLDKGRWRSVAILPPIDPSVPNSDWLHRQLASSDIDTRILSERGPFDVSNLLRLADLMRREGGSLIHAHLFGSAVRAAMLSRLTGIPAIATLHGYGDIPPFERFRRLKVALVNMGIARVVFVSDALRTGILDLHGLRASKATVIPNGLRAERYLRRDGTAFRRELGITDDAFIVGSIGNLNPAKAIDVFLRAAALLKTRAAEYHFVIVGDLKGEQGARLSSLRDSLGLEGDVVFTGFRHDIPEVLAALDIYALTSTSEGFSISLVEAMASGLPVVATRCGGPEAIVEHGLSGLLVDNGSPEAVAAAIETLRADKMLREKMGVYGRQIATTQYSFVAQIATYSQLYEDVASSRA